MKKLIMSTFAVLCAFFSLPAALQAGPPATIDRLDWMTGNWAGSWAPISWKKTGLPQKAARSRPWCE